MCKYPKASRAIADLTRNLMAHKARCDPDPVGGSSSIKHFAHSSMYSAVQLHFLLTIWVAWHHRPYAIVQDAELLEILHMLYRPVEIPSACTLSRDVQEVFAVYTDPYITQEYPGKLHLGVDGWAAPNIFLFLGMTMTRCLGASLVTMILDFIWCIGSCAQSEHRH
ncbi:hypothetical protein K439DRAFT_1323437 [Ramaria rubella]|nr:hypothetical protein K439DRAFT_1323437 [Ramaria rubella]